ncbi:MAG: SGNH/GDSL hydrolase family protein [Verrucomicrobiota bacterium]|nr:SGNH/GDSL hydrolase family protein [Verrucomicrobiota bacterium]
MSRALCCLTIVLAWCAALTPGCAIRGKPTLERQIGESVVFIGQEPASLAHVPVPSQRVVVRNTYLQGPDTITYEDGRDYVVNYRAATVQRPPGSRLPDFQTNILYGQEQFDHTKFPGFGNTKYFAFVDYSYLPVAPWPVQPSQAHLLKLTQAKLKAGKQVKIVAFGDSITAGGDATKPELIFWKRWADALQRKYPQARVTAVNGATGGDSTVQGLQRLQTKVLNESPDLVLIGFGMNDHNVGGVPIPQFKANLHEMIERIRSETGAEIILFSAFPPNPKWKFGSHRMADYAEATRQVAAEAGCAYADVFTNWQHVAAYKKPEDLLGNNINHPNDFGHWIYFRVLEALGL